MHPVTVPISSPLHGWLLGPHWPAEDKRAPGGNVGQGTELVRSVPVHGKQPAQAGWYLSFLGGN